MVKEIIYEVSAAINYNFAAMSDDSYTLTWSPHQVGGHVFLTFKALLEGKEGKDMASDKLFFLCFSLLCGSRVLSQY